MQANHFELLIEDQSQSPPPSKENPILKETDNITNEDLRNSAKFYIELGYQEEDVMRIIRILDRRGISIKQEEILDYLEPQRENLFYHEFYSETPGSDICEFCLKNKESHSTTIGFLDAPPPLSLQKSVRSQQSEKGTMCQICLEEFKSIEDFNNFPCGHSFCKPCTTSYLVEKITSNNMLEIFCPQNGCPYILSDGIIESMVNQFTYTRYTKFKNQALINRDPNKRFCPGINCTEVIDILKAAPKAIQHKHKCPKCSIELCTKCWRNFHGKMDCAKFEQKEYDQWAKGKEIQLCPKCKVRVEKVSGCNHMTCTSCRHNFCWLCRGKYTGNHYSPANIFGCPGLQNGRFTNSNWPFWKRTLLRTCILFLGLLMVILFVILLAIGLVLLAIIFVPWVIGMMGAIYLKPCYQNILHKSIKCRRKLLVFPLVLFNIVMTPVFLLFLPVLGCLFCCSTRFRVFYRNKMK